VSAPHDLVRAARDSERLSAGALVLAIFAALCSVYGWLAWRHGTPWLFSDEIEFSQLSRSIAATGEPARRGEPLHRISLYTYLIAPVWWLHSTAAAYAAAKYVGVAVMTSAVFPTYLLARTVVGRPAALFAAGGSVAVPALVYSSFLVEEPLAYTWSALCLLLIARALATRRRALIIAAAAASLVAPLVRNQLAVLPAVYALAALWLVWTSEWARARRRNWSAWHWIGAVALFAAAAIAAEALIAHQSLEWEVATRHWRGRMLDNGLWAAGALTIGLGVFPVVAGLAGAWRPRNEARTPADRVFAATFAAAVGGFGLYTAAKAAYISTVFSTLVVERNLIYVVPLLFVSTAVVLERRRVRPAALAGAAAFVAYLIATTPYKMEFHFYSDAPGLAILAWLNRTFGWTPAYAQNVLLWMLAASVLVLALTLLPRSYDRGARYVLAVAAALTLAWTMTGEITGARAANSFSDDFLRNLPEQLDWVDRVTGGQPALYIGQQFADPNGVWLLEFWNRSVRKVWSVAEPAPGPGPTLTPDVVDRFGRLSADPGYRWAVADRGVYLVGDIVAETKNGWRLYRLHPPLRLSRAVTGVFSDGWIGVQGKDPKSVTATYSYYATEGSRAGTIFVTVSRRGWCGPDVPGRVLIQVGELGIGPDRHPVIRRVTQERGWVVHSCNERTFPIPTPRPPFHVTVTVTPPFIPAELAPKNSTDLRRLGAQVGFDFSERAD
jgi:hypothetical protein